MKRVRELACVALLSLACAGAARSQEMAYGGGATVVAGPASYSPSMYRTGPFVPVGTSYGVPIQSVYWPPYSYWAAYPLPARDYVGYGTNDFPFYGRRYGSASDPWSWSALAGYPSQYRYYYPPVR